jgi:hypothetical protein
VEIIKKNVAEGHLDRFPWLWRFPQAFPFRTFLSFCFFFFLCENPRLFPEKCRARIAYKRRSRAEPTSGMAGLATPFRYWK